MKSIRYALEYAGLRAALFFFDLFPLDMASNMAGKVASIIGPRLPSNRVAQENMAMVMPDLDPALQKEIIADMWDHLGRMIVEYRHLEALAADITMEGIEHLKAALEESGQAILISGHIGNWEIMAASLSHAEIPIDLLYRPLNNPHADRILNRYRSLDGKLKTLPKSQKGVRMLVQRLNDGFSAGILIDQKYKEGIEVPFMGRPAMTSPAFAQLAQRNDTPLIPFRVERVDGTAFKLSFFPAIPTRDEAGTQRSVEQIIADAHDLLESWIRERPDQWLWIHRRWIESPEKIKKAKKTKAPRPQKDQPPTPDPELPAA